MMNINKRDRNIHKLFSDKNLCTKIHIFFSTASAGDDWDSYEENLVYTNLNPITIKGYVRAMTLERLAYKEYGLSQMGAKEILCDSKYKKWFNKCNKIHIGEELYEVFKAADSTTNTIIERPFNMIRVTIVPKA